MRLPNGYGGVTKLSGRRRKPYMVRKTIGWHIDEKNDKKVQDYVVIGYAATKSEALQMLADYNNNPFDVSASKITFKEVYDRWSAEKFPTVSESNVKGYQGNQACRAAKRRGHLRKELSHTEEAESAFESAL